MHFGIQGVATTLPAPPVLSNDDARFLSDFVKHLRNYSSCYNGNDAATILGTVKSVLYALHELPGLRTDVRTLETKVAAISPDSSSLENAADIEALQRAIRDLSERIDNLNPNYGAF